MDHAFELAFNLLDEAAGRIQEQQYGITRILFHNHGDIALTTVHEYTRADGHNLVLIAADDHGPLATIDAYAPDLETDPDPRIVKVRAGELTFHEVPQAGWTYRAAADGHTYTLTAGIGDEPMWTTTIDDTAPVTHDDLEDAVTTLLTHRERAAAA